MNTIVAIIAYLIILLLFGDSKLKPCWILCVGFNVGYLSCKYVNEIINFFN